MQIIKYPQKEEWTSILARPTFDTTVLFDKVKEVLDDIKEEGDKALKRHTKLFDKVDIELLEVSRREMIDAENLVSQELKDAIEIAHRNIYIFHEAQKQEEKKIETSMGVYCWQKSLGIEKVGLYIPGGAAPNFSTVLMLATPATIAECREIILCTPPDSEGKIHPSILYAAQKAGVSRVFKVGGTQAIAAMAYGTETIPKVYKIFGSGDQHISAAKQLVSLHNTAIDMPSGPSEVEVLADETADASFVAADLLSQAEKGPDSKAILISTSEELLEKVLTEVELQLKKLPHKEYIEQSLENSKIILVHTLNEAIEMTNHYAPEHLIIATKDYLRIAERIFNAGSVFLGSHTPESAGHYASGANHTLPANAHAKVYSGVNLDSFVRKITFQHISPEGLENLGKTLMVMAENEELHAHKNAVAIRLKDLK